MGNLQSREDLVNTLGKRGAEKKFTPDHMDFEDLCQLYLVFKHRQVSDYCQLCFELSKQALDQENLYREDLVHFCVKIWQLEIDEANSLDLEKGHGLDPRIRIKKDDFVGVFKRVQKLKLFTMMPNCLDGFKEENLNMQPLQKAEIQMDADLKKRLAIKILGVLEDFDAKNEEVRTRNK